MSDDRVNLHMSSEAEKYGFVTVEGIGDDASLLELASSLGHPAAGADGQLIKELRVMQHAAAPRRTLSAAFGTASFPLHTDTAFWNRPARFLVMRATGDLRRPTLVCPFEKLLSSMNARLIGAACKAIWVLASSTGPIYCGLTSRSSGGHFRCRYDRGCMAPANSEAREIDEYMNFAVPDSEVQQLSWSSGTAVVIANWQALHARGPEPPQEADRILKRIYVR